MMTETAQRVDTPTIEVRHIRKRYGRVIALSDVSLGVYPGDCLGLLGDNGAGKSTLVKILCGSIAPDDGELVWEGVPTALRNPAAARAIGIETVHQDLALATTLDAATNIFLGREPLRRGLLGKLGVLDRRRMQNETDDLLGRLKINIGSSRRPVDALSGGQRQAVAIARSIGRGQRVLLLDEPTAALGATQKMLIMNLIRQLREDMPEMSIILVSHDLPQVLKLTNRIVVLRQGQVAGEFMTSDSTEHGLIATMTGANL